MINQPLAIVGMGCRFPGGVTDVASYWDLLLNRRSGITEVPANRWDWRKYYHPNPDVPGRMVTKWGGFVAHHDQFDAQFFGISPREAQQMDPQQRWLLETSWQALEDAGLPPAMLRGRRVGVFVGISSHDQIDAQRGDNLLIDIHTGTGSALSIAANRLSYNFDFRGPSLAVDTACSSALVATYLACHSLWAGEGELALVGGVNMLLNPNVFISFSKASMLSPDGQCFTFDHRANGYVRGEGVGVVVIKPLRQAQIDGDRVYAVIRAAAVNQDGHTSSLTVPGVAAQAAMLREAYQAGDIAPGRVVYIEAHGTGTPVGDPIEAQALGRVLGQNRPPESPCLIGSVKTNIGHLESASGMAGLIKAALILHHQLIPPQLNFERANPNIPLTELGLQVVTETRPLSRPAGLPPLVGVNSFGFGGTNAHLVLEPLLPPEPASPPAHPVANRPWLLPLSAPIATALPAQAEAYHSFLANPPAAPGEITAAAGLRRDHFNHRLVVLGQAAADLRSRLRAYVDGATSGPGLISGQPETHPTPPVFVFTGQGAQWWGMGRQLLAREPLFRQTIAAIDALFQPLSGWSLLAELTRPEAESQIDRTDIAQPAIFALQVALVQLWAAWGIRPAKVIGHSVGEVAAAYVAGIYSLPDAVKIIYHRSRLQHTTAGWGSMAAVGLSLAEARRTIAGHESLVEVGAVNSPGLVTLTGEAAALAEILAGLETAGKFVRRLPINYAFHSYQMEAIRAELLAALADIQPQPGHTPFISTVTGAALAGPALTADYWWRNVRRPVYFGPALAGLIESGDAAFLELGPHPALQSSIHDCLAEQKRTGHVFHSLRRDTDESLELLGNLAALHVYGLPLNWGAVNQADGRFARLPGYVWQRQSYWLTTETQRRLDLEPLAHPLLGMRLPAPHPTWEQRLDPRVVDYLADHRIWDSVVFPAAGYGEIGLAVARLLFPAEGWVVESLHIKKALFVPVDHLPTVQVVFDETGKTFSVYSAGGDKKEWQLHAHGQLRKLAPVAPPPADLPALQARLAVVTDKETYYQTYHNLGYQFGPNFQQIQRIWSAPGYALAEVTASAAIRRQMDDYHFHPVLLDACLQSVSAVAGLAAAASPGERLYLPAAIGRIQQFGRSLPDKFWVWASLSHHNRHSLTVDLQVYDERGAPLAQILAARFDRAPSKSSTAAEFYQFQWQVQPLNFAPGQATTPATYLLLADRQGVATALAEALARTGARVITAAAAGPDSYTLNPVNEAGLSQLLAASRSDDAPLAAIIHAWGLDHPPANELSGAQMAAAPQTGVLHALRLVHAVAAENFPRPPALVFLSRDTQPVLATDHCAGLANAPLIGFLRTANNEYPAFQWRLIDLDPARPLDEIDCLRQELLHSDTELEVAYRQGCRYVNRLRPIKPEALAPYRRNAVQADGQLRPYRLQIEPPGLLTRLSLNETRRRAPGPAEIEVQVLAGGLNFRDVMKALGLYPGNPVDLTWLGDDFAGVVTAVGEQVTDLRPGDAVAGLAQYAFRAFVTVNRQAVFKLPPHLNFIEAATLPTVFLTAYYALVHLARLQPGERVLIHAAAGGVGQAALQIARDLGLEIFATAGSPEKRALLAEQGVPHIFDSRSLNFADDIMRVTNGRGVDAVLNSLAGDFISKNLAVLAPFGRYLEIGKVDVYGNSKIGLEALRRNISLFIIDLAELMDHRPAEFAAMVETLRRKFERQSYCPLPHQIFPITEAVEAFRTMAAGKHIGKIVLSFQADEIPVGRSTEAGSLFRPNASYLITGGAGGFGLEVAKWLARQGARRLVLLSRSGPPDDAARAELAQLRAAGVTVQEVRGDVTLWADVERVVREIQAGPAPLAGVVHSAMALNDQPLANLDEAGFNRAFWPKMLGAWHLHLATLNLPLEHFICFSSISGLVGNPKQANYNAGNTFLDALAGYRRARGLPALTINWGRLAGAGYLVSHQQVADYLQAAGIGPLPADEALHTLGRLLPLEAGQVGVVAVNWNRLAGYLPVINTGVFRDLLQPDSAGQTEAAFIAQLGAAAPAERLALVQGFLARHVAQILGAAAGQIDPAASLNQLGLDSLMALELINSVNAHLPAPLAISDVLSSSTLPAVAKVVLAKIEAAIAARPEPTVDAAAGWLGVLDQPEAQVDLLAEAQLDPAIGPEAAASPPVTLARTILLTGATGFLGAFLLADLLRQTSADIYCLVRADTVEAGLARLRANLAHYGLWADPMRARLHPIPGDLTQPRLGLTAALFAQLAAQVDAIYHNGAVLNLLQPYAALKPANVLSVQEVLRLAGQTKIKPVHYVSTIAVFYAAGQSRQTVIRESDWPEPHHLRGGYMQSKWVAEQLVRQAQTRGLPCSIYRPGLISGHSQTGVTNHQDLTSRLVKGSYQLGLYPDRNREVNIVPVDYVSRAIVHLSQQPESWGKVFHLTNPQPTPLNKVITWAGLVGAALQEAPFRAWRVALIEQWQRGVENDLLPLLPFFSSDRPEQVEQPVECHNTLHYLAGSGIACPPVDAGLVKTYVDYMVASGFLDVKAVGQNGD